MAPMTVVPSPVKNLKAELANNDFRGPVHTDAATRTVYGTDNSIYQLDPVGVVIPQTHADLSAIAAANHALAQPFDLVARGGGTGTNGQSLTNGLVVDLRRGLNRILFMAVDAWGAKKSPLGARWAFS